MMFDLKALSAEAVPRALEKAERYRLLNEPGEAESICHDVLAIDSDNQEALITLLLALTEQFDTGGPRQVIDAQRTAERIRDAYSRAYYTGIICERRAKAQLREDRPGSGARIFGLLRDAMDWFEKAEAMRPIGNDDALLRWNACARILMRDDRLAPAVEEREEPLFLE